MYNLKLLDFYYCLFKNRSSNLIKKVVIASGLSKLFEVDNVIVEALKNVKVKPKAIIMIVFYQALRIPESLLDYKLLKNSDS
jgi:hypothetical protein